MCSDYWAATVPGCPQRHTKAQRNTPQGTFLIHDSACLWDQPKESKDHLPFSLNSNYFFPAPVHWKFSISSISCTLSSPFWMQIPPCRFLPSAHFSVIFPKSSIIIFSPLLILPHKLAHPPSQFPSLFLIFLYNIICLPFALTINISPFSVIICLWQLWRAPCLEMGKSRFFWKLRVHRQMLGKCDQGDNKVDQKWQCKMASKKKKTSFKTTQTFVF